MYYFIMVFVECLLNAEVSIQNLYSFFSFKLCHKPMTRDITAFYRDEEAAISRQNNDNPLKSQRLVGDLPLNPYAPESLVCSPLLCSSFCTCRNRRYCY